jgi:hypothetical protein
MNKQVCKIVGTLTLVLLAALAVPAFHADPVVAAEIPFDFVVGSKALPLGKYTVRPLTQQAVMIQSEDTQSSAIVLTTAVQAPKTLETGKLVFNRYGDQYFLSQIWTVGNNTGRELSKSKLEREVAKLHSEQRVVAAIPTK